MVSSPGLPLAGGRRAGPLSPGAYPSMPGSAADRGRRIPQGLPALLPGFGTYPGGTRECAPASCGAHGCTPRSFRDGGSALRAGAILHHARREPSRRRLSASLHEILRDQFCNFKRLFPEEQSFSSLALTFDTPLYRMRKPDGPPGIDHRVESAGTRRDSRPPGPQDLPGKRNGLPGCPRQPGGSGYRACSRR